MKLTWSDLIAIIAILSALVGFTFAGPGTARQVAQSDATVIYQRSVRQHERTP